MKRRWKWYQSRIKNLTLVQSSHLAGVIDCDGCIHFDKGRKIWRVRITNTDNKFIEYLSKVIGVSNFTSQTRNRNDQWSRKTIFTLEISAMKEVTDLLQAITPYLIIKKSIAIKAIDETRKKLDG